MASVQDKNRTVYVCHRIEDGQYKCLTAIISNKATAAKKFCSEDRKAFGWSVEHEISRFCSGEGIADVIWYRPAYSDTWVRQDP